MSGCTISELIDLRYRTSASKDFRWPNLQVDKSLKTSEGSSHEVVSLHAITHVVARLRKYFFQCSSKIILSVAGTPMVLFRADLSRYQRSGSRLLRRRLVITARLILHGFAGLTKISQCGQ